MKLTCLSNIQQLILSSSESQAVVEICPQTLSTDHTPQAKCFQGLYHLRVLPAMEELPGTWLLAPFPFGSANFLKKELVVFKLQSSALVKTKDKTE